jgi:hypothetical protein
MTATGSGTLSFRIYSGNGGSVGDTVYTDNVSIIKN